MVCFALQDCVGNIREDTNGGQKEERNGFQYATLEQRMMTYNQNLVKTIQLKERRS